VFCISPKEKVRSFVSLLFFFSSLDQARKAPLLFTSPTKPTFKIRLPCKRDVKIIFPFLSLPVPYLQSRVPVFSELALSLRKSDLVCACRRPFDAGAREADLIRLCFFFSPGLLFSCPPLPRPNLFWLGDRPPMLHSSSLPVMNNSSVFYGGFSLADPAPPFFG